MGVPTSEVGYTAAMSRREDHKVHKGHVVALGKKSLHKDVCLAVTVTIFRTFFIFPMPTTSTTYNHTNYIL